MEDGKRLIIVPSTEDNLRCRTPEGIKLAQLKQKYGREPWYKELGGDYSGSMANASADELKQLQEAFNMDIDLNYDPVPALNRVKVPMLWVIAGKDTEAPSALTMVLLKWKKHLQACSYWVSSPMVTLTCCGTGS